MSGHECEESGRRMPSIYIERFGLEGYFVRSRKMLKELKCARTAQTET